MIDTATMGRNIRKVRREQKLTQPDLALLANVGVRFLVDLENGKETCQIGLALKVMQALGIILEMQLPGHEQTIDDDLDLEFGEGGGISP